MPASHWQPSLSGPLSRDELDTILADAIAVLSRIGVACAHRETIRRLTSVSGIGYREGRLRFSQPCVAGLVERVRRATRPSPDDGKLSLGGCWAGLCYCDPETLNVRRATTAEARLMARLWDARGLGGVVPLMPGDVPPELVTLASERIALFESRALGGGLPVRDAEEARCLIEMNLAAGRRYRLMQQVAISPLRLNDEGLNIALQFLGNADVEVHLAGAIPMVGVTCPLDPRAALTQSLAEELGFAVVREVLTGELGIGCPRAEPFDLRDAAIVFGSPEWCLLRAMVFQVYEHATGMPLRSGSFRSVAKQPDEQAASERMASVLWQALLGARRFGAVGQLSVDEVFSPQQVILDEEILAYVQRLVAGLSWEGESPAEPARAGDRGRGAGDVGAGPRARPTPEGGQAQGPAPTGASRVPRPTPQPEAAQDAVLALIEEGVAEGNFAGLESTARRFRGFYSFPDLFRHWNVGRWQSEGSPSILSLAWRRAKGQIALSDYRLPESQAAEVERICAKAEAHASEHRPAC